MTSVAQCKEGTIVLVATATSNTASKAVAELSAKNIAVRALVRDIESDKAKALGALPGVTLVKGDFDDEASIIAALKGVNRAILVSDGFAPTQFDRETSFFQLAKEAGVEATIRISTCSGLIHPGTTGTYGRAHHGIEAFADFHRMPVVHIRPDFFMSNWLMSAGEVAATGKVSYPVQADCTKFNGIDPRDVGGAAAFIATLASDQLQLMIDEKAVEVHGPEAINFADIAKALSASCGYEITVNTMDGDAWQAVVEGTGLPRTYARSFRHTVENFAGERPFYSPQPSLTSPRLMKMGWAPRYDLKAWSEQESIKQAFAKAETYLPA
jgi:uncharacterized protein YbjT (DUF2867 family)